MKNKFISVVAVVVCLAFTTSVVAFAGEKDSAKKDTKSGSSCCMGKTASSTSGTCSDGTKCTMGAHKASMTSKKSKVSKTMASKTKKSATVAATTSTVNN